MGVRTVGAALIATLSAGFDTDHRATRTSVGRHEFGIVFHDASGEFRIRGSRHDDPLLIGKATRIPAETHHRALAGSDDSDIQAQDIGELLREEAEAGAAADPQNRVSRGPRRCTQIGDVVAIVRDVALARNVDGIDIAYGNADHVPALTNPRMVVLTLRLTSEINDTHAVTDLVQNLPDPLNTQREYWIISRY